ncbi:MAG: hypothetical protein K2W95_14240 [Candidatus Obscuribacterales bacterium]|nr:hypothetical protein [Candidatus Obscuribacterales bacterium]
MIPVEKEFDLFFVQRIAMQPLIKSATAINLEIRQTMQKSPRASYEPRSLRFELFALPSKKRSGKTLVFLRATPKILRNFNPESDTALSQRFLKK